MNSRVLVPLFFPSTSYSEWKLKMISYLKRESLYEISIGAGEKSYEELSDWMNDCDRAFGSICLVISPNIRYLVDYAKHPKDLWTTLDRVLGKHNEDSSSNMDFSLSRCLGLYILL